MSARRAVAAALVACGLLGSGTAYAARPACGLVTDPSGDARGGTVEDGSSDPNLDVVSGDVGTDGHRLVVSMRLSSHAATDTAAPAGRAYLTELTVALAHPPVGTPVTAAAYYVVAYVDATGAVTGEWGRLNGGVYSRLGAAAVTVDAAVARVRVVVSITTTTAPWLVARGNIVGGVRQSTFRLVAIRPPLVAGGFDVWAATNGVTSGTRPFVGLGRDVADSARTYRTGAPSCA